jgi:hypothetical protein
MSDGRRQPSCDGTSRMTRECQVRICERLGVRFPGPTRPISLRPQRDRIIVLLTPSHQGPGHSCSDNRDHLSSAFL